jgi:GT2 family glycosyltransferase
MTEPKTPTVSVVIPVFNQVHWTERCLNSLLEHSEIARDLIIIDNCSTDSTPQVLNRFASPFMERGWKFTVIRNEENLGFGRACNQGIKIATGEYITILNNDTWHMPGWDTALARAIETLDAAMVGPFYFEKEFNEKKLLKRSLRFSRWNRGKYRRFWVPMMMFFRRAAFEQVGVFDERYFVSFEEIDLRVRFDRAGLKFFMVGDCFIWHAVKGTRGHAHLIPSSHEAEGRRLFMEKWGFDPDDLRPGYRSWPERIKRRLQRIRNGLDLF